MTVHSAKVKALNEDAIRTLLPAIVYIGILMLIGLTGNPLVIFFYGRKAKQAPSYMFIITLAVFDLMSCLLSMPLEIVDLVHFYTFHSRAACKVLRFFTFFAVIASGSILLAIAAERYRKMCKPFQTQLSIEWTKRIIIMLVVLSIVSAVPAGIINDVVTVNITRTTGNEKFVVGHDCTSLREDRYTPLILAYNIYLFILLVVGIISLISLYVLVGKELCRMNATHAHMQNLNAHHVNTKKYTRVMLAITIVYIVSFLPTLILITWRIIAVDYEPNNFSDAELLSFQIAIRLHFLSSVSNPVIYVVSHVDFKKFVLSLFCRCKIKNCRKSNVHVNNNDERS